MDAQVTVTATGKTTYDGKPTYAVSVDGTLVGHVHRHDQANLHSTNNVLTHVTTRRGWRYEVAASVARVTELANPDDRYRVRLLTRNRITWDTRRRAVAELVTVAATIARLRGEA